jgi:hypothetical protein
VEADVVVPEVVGGVQSAISSLPDCDIFPAGHWVQVLSDQAPVDAENVPAWQLSHAVLAPAEAMYFPAPQLSHAVLTPAVSLYLPAVHSVQTVEALTPENLPASQLSQAADPDVSLNLPAMQNEQSPSGPVKPALH